MPTNPTDPFDGVDILSFKCDEHGFVSGGFHRNGVPACSMPRCERLPYPIASISAMRRAVVEWANRCAEEAVEEMKEWVEGSEMRQRVACRAGAYRHLADQLKYG